MTCGVLQQACSLRLTSPFAFEKTCSLCGSIKDQGNTSSSRRESLDFEFESDVLAMSAPDQIPPVASLGIGLNGRLLRAIIQSKAGSVKYYLKCGADPNVTTPDKRSALHLAVLSSNMKIVKRLLDAGAFHSPLDQVRRSPLHLACTPPQLGFIQTLLDGGADPNAGIQPQSVLHCAIMEGSVQSVKVLVEAGADVNVIGFQNYHSSPLSPLGLAFYQEQWRSMIPILLNAGARQDNILGTCPLASALEAVLYTKRDAEIIKYLIQNNCIPSHEDIQSKPFISFKCQTFTRSLIALLLRLVQDGIYDIETVGNLISMLELSGYDLRKDFLSCHLMGHVLRTATSKPMALQGKPYTTNYELNASQVKTALSYFHWGGVSTTPSDDLVTYVNGLIQKLSSPQVPRLASLCRLRVRVRLVETQKKNGLKKFVDGLPLPNLIKRYVMLEDFD